MQCQLLDYKCRTFKAFPVLALVAQTLDSAIHQINYYPADNAIVSRNTYPLDSDLIRWISAIQLLNNRRLDICFKLFVDMWSLCSCKFSFVRNFVLYVIGKY